MYYAHDSVGSTGTSIDIYLLPIIGAYTLFQNSVETYRLVDLLYFTWISVAEAPLSGRMPTRTASPPRSRRQTQTEIDVLAGVLVQSGWQRGKQDSPSRKPQPADNGSRVTIERSRSTRRVPLFQSLARLTGKVALDGYLKRRHRYKRKRIGVKTGSSLLRLPV
ncbi:hypothetical protein BDN67DRAFT_650652 [Paxillus ammoniavirescens]|nr:hypothetical protein BDN67DRAFT_650652 [Paxillus ammoniavirescens]